MGSKDNNDLLPHEVCVKSFCIGKYEVSQGEWKKIMKVENPSKNKSSDDYPVENVNWTDAKSFLEELTKISGRNYRLPTEAEWEYAARGRGSDEVWSGTSKESEIDVIAWHRGNSDGKTHPVGLTKPNALGIHDMTGNVWEWVEDDYSSDSYKTHVKNNPIENSGSRTKVRRGGSFELKANDMKNVSRDGHRKGSTSADHGFRAVFSVN
jgi:formylglycine-generating enzyme required for sulfatase activity